MIFYLVGVVLTVLILKWAKLEFRTNLDKDGVKILAGIFWPVVLLTELADFISAMSDRFVSKVNSDKDSVIGKFAVKLGDLYRKIF